MLARYIEGNRRNMITNARKNTYASMRAIHKFTNSIVLKTQRTYRLEDHFFIHVKILKFQFFFVLNWRKHAEQEKDMYLWQNLRTVTRNITNLDLACAKLAMWNAKRWTISLCHNFVHLLAQKPIFSPYLLKQILS